MANHRVGETGPSLNHHHNIPYALLHGLNIPTAGFMHHQEGSSSFDFGELEEAIVLQGVKVRNDDEAKPPPLFRPAPTLEMFPSWPIRSQHTPRGSSKSGGGGGESTGEEDSGSAVNTVSFSSQKQQQQLEQPESESPISKKASFSSSSDHHHQAFDQKKPMQNRQNLHLHQQQLQQFEMASDNTPSSRTGTSQNQSAAAAAAKPLPQEKRRGSTSEKQLDAKTLRRLAQNREAARKSRLRKKAYVQQLETSRIKLTQIEQDLQRSRSQGLFLGGPVGNISSGAAIFDMEYGRWLEDDQRHMSELRTGLHAHLSDSDLRIIVDSYLSHYDGIFHLKGTAAKSDVFHLITGTWATPAERCFLWIGGFRPSELVKMLISQLDPLTEHQVMGIYSLQHSSQQAEEALTQGLEQLQQSLIDTVAASGPVIDGMQQMAVALGKLANLEGFIRQADNLRQQTLHQLARILTVRQAARCFLVIGEYYGRLRALSSLWTSRPRESLISDDHSCQTTTDLQMVQPSHNHFSSFSFTSQP